MNVEERVGRVEEAILILKELNINHSERLDGYFKALKESREDFDFKMNAVIDAQMQNEVDIREIKGSIVEVRGSIVELKDSMTEVRSSIVEIRGSMTEVKGSIVEIRGSIVELRDSINGLAEASKSQLGRIENLENK